MGSRSTTFVTVVFEGDELMLRLQARSIARYAQQLPDTRIIVIENFRSPRSGAWRERHRALYGALSKHVRFIAANDLVTNTRCEGWWKQQLLKLAIERHVETDTYLVLDGKTLLIRELQQSDLFADSGKPKMAVSVYPGHPLEWFFDRAMSYFTLDRTAWAGAFVETAPPFMIDTRICRELIAYLEAREGGVFEEAFLSTGVTEFFLYGAYIVSRHQSLEAVYDIADLNCETIWPHEANLEKSRIKFETVEKKGCAFFSVHRRALGNMSTETIAAISEFLHRKGLDEADDTALRVLTQTGKKGRREQAMMDLKNRISWRLKSLRQRFGRAAVAPPAA